MKIETKYNIGDKICVGYKHNDEIHLYEDTIQEITIIGDIEHTPMGTTNTRKIEYIGEKCPEGLLEEEIVLFGNDTKLAELIRRLNDENV